MNASCRSAYLHVPFCRHRCGYCNFTLIAGRDDLIDAYLTALERELRELGEPVEIDTLFVGGGTPTHLPPAQWTRLMEAVDCWLPRAAAAEFSVEANPIDLLDADRVESLAGCGVNRVSLGVQSFDAAKLRALERDHDPETAAEAVRVARRRFPQVSLDLIFASPGESLDVWMRDLQRALSAGPDHLSTYGMTYEKGAAFWSRREKRELTAVGEELERTMYEAAIRDLNAAGFEHYEVSNFARPGARCRHNQVYWDGGDYFGFGPGAASHFGGLRRMNHRSTLAYIRRLQNGRSAVAEQEQLTPVERARERMVFALRMLDGLEREQFAAQTGFDVDQLAGPAIRRYVEWGHLQDTGGRLRLTPEGLMVSDGIWPDLLAE